MFYSKLDQKITLHKNT